MKQAQSPAPASEREVLPMQMDVRIHALRASGPVLADASMTLNGCFAVRGVRVIDSENGPFVSMPGYKGRDGYKDVCFPCTKEFHREFQQAVLDAYQQAMTQFPQRQQENNGVPAANQRSVCGGERRSSEVSESCRMRQDEGYGACDDAAPPAPEIKM